MRHTNPSRWLLIGWLAVAASGCVFKNREAADAEQCNSRDDCKKLVGDDSHLCEDHVCVPVPVEDGGAE